MFLFLLPQKQNTAASMSSDAGGDSASTPVPLRHESVTSGGFKSGTLTWRIENFLTRLDFAEVTGEKTLRSNSLDIVFGESKKGQFKDDLVSFRLEIRWNPPVTGRNNGGQVRRTILPFLLSSPSQYWEEFSLLLLNGTACDVLADILPVFLIEFALTLPAGK